MAIMGHLTVLLEWVHQRLTAIFLQFVEKNLVPDWLLRFAVRYLLTKHLADRTAVGEEYQEKLEAFVDELKGMPIAIETDAANEQHYELPTEYFERCLGKHKKYSSCLWADQNTTLDEAEESMLALYCERAQLSDGQDVLELGCGWGSLCMFVAARYPKSRVTAVSNSKTQREYINAQCADRGIKNLTVITANLVHFQPPKTADGVIAFDRVVSVECLEHMKNYQELLKRIASWMKPGGLLFVHIFVENSLPSHFTMDNPDDWMARYFFSGGTMPSADLLLHFQDDLAIQKQWYINGSHYSRTLEAWLDRMDAQKTEIMPIFKARNELQRSDDEGDEVWEDHQGESPAALTRVSTSGGGDEGAVTSRLSALKARLAAEKAKSSSRQAEISRLSSGEERPELHSSSDSARMHSSAPAVPAVPSTSASRLSRGGEMAQQLSDSSTNQLVRPVGFTGPDSRQISGGLLDSDGFTDVSLEASPAKSAHESTQYGLARHKPTQATFEIAATNDAAARRSSPAIATGSAVEGGAQAVESARLREELQRLKVKLMQTSTAHEEEQDRIEAAADARIAALESELYTAMAQCKHTEGQMASSEARFDQQSAAALEEASLRSVELHQQVATLQQTVSVAQTESRAAATSAREEILHQSRVAIERQLQLEQANAALAVDIAAVQRDLRASRLAESAAQAQQEALDSELLDERAAHEGTLQELEMLQAAGHQPDHESMQSSAVTDLQLRLDQAQAELEHMRIEAQRVSENSTQQHLAAEKAAEATRAEGREAAMALTAEQAQHEATQEVVKHLRGAQASSDDSAQLQATLEAIRRELAAATDVAEAEAAECERLRGALEMSEAQAERAYAEAAEIQQVLDSAKADGGKMQQKIQELEGEVEKRIRAGEEVSEASSRAQQDIEAAETALAERDVFWQRELAAAANEHVEGVRQLQQHVTSLEASAAASSHGLRQREAALQQELAAERRALQGTQRLLSSAEQQVDIAQEQAVASAVERDRVWQGELAESQAALQGLQVSYQQLQQRHQATLAAAAAGSGGGAEASALRQQAEELQMQLREAQRGESRLEVEVERLVQESAARQLQLSQQGGQAQMGTSPIRSPPEEEAGKSGAATDVSLVAALEAAQQGADEAIADRDRARAQLSRMKQQMLEGQDTDDDKLAWRVEAELRLRLDELRRTEGASSAQLESEVTQLQAQQAASESYQEELRTSLAAWEAAVTARDVELRSLQSALGELAYESDAAERLRHQLRTATTECANLQRLLEVARTEGAVAAADRGAALQEAAAARQADATQRDMERRLQEEATMLRRALAESMKRVKLMATEETVDRRIVVKLLITYFERDRSPEVLQLMFRMLGFTDEDKRRMGLGQQPRKGVLKTVATMPFNIVRGGVALVVGGGGDGVMSPRAPQTPVGDGLADQWIDFLIEQAERDGAAAETQAGNVVEPTEEDKPEQREGALRSGEETSASINLAGQFVGTGVSGLESRPDDALSHSGARNAV